MPRLPASEIEAAVFKSVRARFDCNGLASAECAEKYLRRVVIHAEHVAITLKTAGDSESPAVEFPLIANITEIVLGLTKVAQIIPSELPIHCSCRQ